MRISSASVAAAVCAVTVAVSVAVGDGCVTRHSTVPYAVAERETYGRRRYAP
ncbi:hypothetical protein [Streptomyces naganishii]|uniref:hypothetical protein n=1 Tax=Streptomyces naganishii TaxID=285447 RepID=UPI00167EE2F2|nr:hypothetical protein [Streptomyces naganishii]